MSDIAAAAAIARRAWLKPRIADHRPVIGTFIDLPHPAAVEVAAASGFDFLILDGEHSALGVALLPALVTAAEIHGVPAIVRVPGAEVAAIAQALDAGAAGILVPRVNDAAEAARVAVAAHYPPAGARGLGPGRASGYGLAIPAYVAEARARTLVAIQIETRSALQGLDDILAVAGIDMIFVGPADLAASLGHDGPTDPALQPVVADVLARARAAGRLTGVFAPNAERAAHWLGQGASLVALATDLMLLAQGARAALGALRRAADH